MDRGWGLTLDSDSLGFFTQKKPQPAGFLKLLNNNNNNNTKVVEAEKHHHQQILRGGDCNNNKSGVSMFSGLDLLANINRHHRDSSLSTDENRVIVGEVDFFSENKRGSSSTRDDKDTSSVSVKREDSHSLHGDSASQKPPLDVNTGLRLLTANTGSDQSTVDDGVSSDMVEKRAKKELATLQVELHKMNAENQKLKEMLGQVTNNYTALQMHLGSLLQHQQQNQGADTTQNREIAEAKFLEKKQETIVPRQFLNLGPAATGDQDDQLSGSSSEERTHDGSGSHNADGKRNGRQESPDSETQGWVPNKAAKLDSSSSKTNMDQSAEATMRKARVSVRARSEAPMITDGCQWRKYGQKMAKGNPCPRAYYRCTMAVGCPVRKQVQRCAEDRSILITTYEGNHNHPLPPAAMAMASTTTAAVSMLLSGSMASGDGNLMNPNLLARAILPCSSSMATISASAPFPTVTLDLTHNPNNSLQLQQRSQPQFQLSFPSQPQNFASLPGGHALPQVFGQPLYNQSKFSGLQLSQDIGSSQFGQNNASQQDPPQSASLAETVNAATAAITADPNFTAALAAAISSLMGGVPPNNSTTTTTNPPNSGANINTGNNSNGNKLNNFPGN